MVNGVALHRSEGVVTEQQSGSKIRKIGGSHSHFFLCFRFVLLQLELLLQ